MVFSIIILLLLLLSIYRGYHYGLVLEIIHLVGYIISLILTFRYSYVLYDLVGSLTKSDNNYVIHGISFIALFVILQIIINIFSRIVNHVTHLPIIKQANSLGGVILNLVVTYTMIFILLNVAITLPNDWIHQQYSESTVSNIIVNKTPIITHDVLQKWLK